MNSSSSIYFKNFVTILSANTLGQLIPFLVAPVLTRLYTPVEFAVVANFMAIVGIFGIVSTGRLEMAISLPKEHYHAQNVVFTGLLITLGLGLISIIIPMNSTSIGKWYNDENLPDFLWLVPMSVISMGVLALSNNWNLRQQKYKSISLGKIAQSIFNNGLAALLGYIGWGISGLIISWLISQFINILFLLSTINRKIERNDFGVHTFVKTISFYRDFPLINSLHAFTDVFVTQFLLFWIISTHFGNYKLGLFAVMFRYVSAPINLVTSSVSQLYYVEAGRAVNENKSILPVMLRTMKTSLFFAVPFILVLLIFGPELFSWYLGTDWYEAGELARALSPMFLLSFLVSPISGTPILLKKQSLSFFFSLTGYTLSILSLVIAYSLELEFKNALLLYSIGYCTYQISLLVWYKYLIKSK